jgi:hypothetical protein
MQKRQKITFLIICIFLLLSSAGCTHSIFKNYGDIIPDWDVKNAFETYQINPNLNYYISGSEVAPNVIIGLNNSYTLEPDLWKKIEATPKIFRDHVINMQARALALMLIQHGFIMFDDKGNQIGVWYSILEATTALKMKDNRTAIIYTPDIDIYDNTYKGGP